MSELDKWFGDKKEEAQAVEARRTQYPRSPAHLQPLLDRFDELVREQGVDVNAWMRQQWKNSANEYHEAAGPDVGLLEKAFSESMARGLTIKTLRSLTWYVMQEQMEKRDEYGETASDRAHRQKYLEGWE